jgi:hypothetical protein
MKHLLAAALVLACLLALAGCDLESGLNKDANNGDGDLSNKVQDGDLSIKTFWAYNLTTGAYYQVTAENLAVGRHCIIYKDKNAAVNTSDAKALAQEYDSKMYSLAVNNFGTPLDVDGNGKIILLLLDILDGGSAASYTAGYFWAGNMYQKSSNPKEQTYYSNEADMLYIDTNPGIVNSEGCYSTVVHEMQHLINFSVWAAAADPNKQYTDTWIDEGLSTAAEDLYLGKRLSDRIEWFKEDPLQTIRYGNNFFVWDGYWEQKDEISNYATAYLFFQWLRIHAVNGAGIYKEIINHQYGDYRAVAGAAAVRFSPAINNDWTTLLRTWYAANLLRDSTGLTGYKNEINVTVRYLTSGTSRNLYPGEGVYSLLTANRAYANTGNIIYAGLKRGERIDTGGNYTKDWHLLTLNVNTNLKGKAEMGYTCNIVNNTGGTDSPVPDVLPAARSVSAGTAPAFAGGKLPTIYDWDSAAAARKRFKGWDRPLLDPLGRQRQDEER